jgi:hypothetical protein
MQELLFRAWDEKQQYMAYQGMPDLETLENFMFHFGNCKNIMLFSSYLDKHKKKIYNDDVIKFSTGIEWFDKKLLKVVFEYGCFSVTNIEHDGITCICSKTPMCLIGQSLMENNIFMDASDVMEVVGNLYEKNINYLITKYS